MPELTANEKYRKCCQQRVDEGRMNAACLEFCNFDSAFSQQGVSSAS